MSTSIIFAQNFSAIYTGVHQNCSNVIILGPKKPGQQFTINVKVTNNLEQVVNGQGNVTDDQNYTIKLNKSLFPTWFSGPNPFTLKGGSSYEFPLTFTPPTDPFCAYGSDYYYNVEFDAVKVSNSNIRESFQTQCPFEIWVDACAPVILQTPNITTGFYTSTCIYINDMYYTDDDDQLTRSILCKDNLNYSKTFTTSDNSYRIDNLMPSTTYYLTITCTDRAGNVSLPYTTSIKTLPQPPRNLTISEVTPYSCKLSWNAPLAGTVDGYIIYNGTTRVNNVLISGTSYIINTLCPNNTYKFTVKSFDESAESVNNPSKTVNTPNLASTISGASLICSSANYTISSMPSGASVTFSKSSNLSFGSGGGNWVGVSLVSEGAGWIKAVINKNSCHTPIPTKNIWGGKPKTPELGLTDLQCEGLAVVYDNAQRTDQASSWNWTWVSYLLNAETPTPHNYTCVQNYDPVNTSIHQTDIFATATNACGTSAMGTNIIYLHGGQSCEGVEPIVPPFCEPPLKAAITSNVTNEDISLSAFPNPTTGVVEVVINGSLESNYTIYLFNDMGIMVKMLENNNGTNLKRIDLSSYPAGIYLIRLNVKSDSYYTRIIKE